MNMLSEKADGKMAKHNESNKKHVVSFSGGRTSAYLCYLMKERYGDDVDFVYLETSAEHPKTYEFIRKVDKVFHLNLTCLMAKTSAEFGIGNTWQEISINDIGHNLKAFKEYMAKYHCPTVVLPSCTDRMKTTPLRKYCEERYGKGNFYTWLGIRADEPNRLKFLKTDKIEDMFGDKPVLNNPQGIRYLAEISDFEKQDILDWWKEQPFDLEIDEHLGNCVFCVKKGANKLALAARQEPEMAAKFIEAITSPDVRILNNQIQSDVMYRGNQSLKGIIKMYEDFSEEEIMNTIRSMKREDTGSCSESCEAMGFNDFELEMQEDGNEKA